MTSTPKPSNFVHFKRYKHSNIGIRKANVLPEPVLAAPNKS
jgi:hypothetical protein